MNPLDTLLRWATTMADTDPDVEARPLWALIASEVRAYQTRDDEYGQDGPDLFEVLL